MVKIMLSILNILSFPIFKNFTIISGHKSLNMPVTRTAIFEWESLDDIALSFKKGDFVITSLVTAKDDPVYMEECLKTLIGLQVSCIAIKDIYIKEIPDHICRLSSMKHVPIIIFSGTYYDDIIFAIKQELLLKDLSSTQTNLVSDLLDSSLNNEQVINIAKEINPFFYNNLICCYSLLNKNKDALDCYYHQYLSKLVELSIDSKESILSFVKYKDGILILFSYSDTSMDIYQQFSCFLDQLECLSNGSSNGISSPCFSTDHLKDIVLESIYAAISCKIDETPFKYFNKIGVDQLLIPSAKEYGTKKFYENYFNILHGYDKANNMNLLETLLLYIQSACDIDSVSKTLFQHRNTIRYRINKIKTLLELDGLNDAEFQLYLFTRLYLINQLNDLLPDTKSA